MSGRPAEAPVEARAVAAAVAAALAEDVGPGDITSRACVPAAARGRGVLLAKDAGVLSGLYVAAEVFRQVDKSISLEALLGEGEEFSAGDVLGRVAGPSRSILTAERVSLNFLQRLCGVATITRAYVREVEGTGCTLLDTRKTTPGLRALEKAAVRAGGGHNHRFALYDGFLIKDNHIAAAGSLTAAVEAARRAAPPTFAVEVEAQTFDQVEEALAARAEVIMLDNFSAEKVAEAVRRISGRARTECSGGITLSNLRAYAEAGADYVSVGAVTHHATALDISLELSADDTAEG